MNDVLTTISLVFGIATPVVSILAWYINITRKTIEAVLKSEINGVKRKVEDLSDDVEKISDRLSVIDARSAGQTVDIANVKRNIDDLKTELKDVAKSNDARFAQHQKTLVQWISTELARVKSVKG